MSIICWNNDSLPSGIRLSEVISNFTTMTCAWRHQLLKTHKRPAVRLGCLKSTELELAGSHAELVSQERCRYMLSCERRELRCWQQIWKANLMTSHLHLGRKKNRHPRPLPCSSGASGSTSCTRHQTRVMRAIGRGCVQEVRGVKRL